MEFDRKQTKKELFYYYIKDHKKTIIVYIMSILIFYFLFFLYENKMESVVYGTVFIVVLCLIVGGYDFYQYVNHYEYLYRCRNTIEYDVENMGEDRSLIEKEYQNLIVTLDQKRKEYFTQSEQEKVELEDYFTLWVHQMKLPISAMKIMLETEEMLDRKLLKSELFRIEQYSSMVLAYIRMNSKDTDYQIETCDLAQMIRQSIRTFASEFIRKKIACDFKETKMQLVTDEKWFVFVLEQILSNSLKYTKRGTISIYIQDENTLVVEDTGSGMEVGDCVRSFEKGYTGRNGRIDKKASGLGLYLCKNILNKLSHDIKIESQIGVGTKVKISWKTDKMMIE